MNCEEVKRFFFRLNPISGEINAEKAEVEDHINNCSPCRMRYASSIDGAERLLEVGIKVPESLDQRLLQRIKGTRRRRFLAIAGLLLAALLIRQCWLSWNEPYKAAVRLAAKDNYQQVLDLPLYRYPIEHPAWWLKVEALVETGRHSEAFDILVDIRLANQVRPLNSKQSDILNRLALHMHQEGKHSQVYWLGEYAQLGGAGKWDFWQHSVAYNVLAQRYSSDASWRHDLQPNDAHLLLADLFIRADMLATFLAAGTNGLTAEYGLAYEESDQLLGKPAWIRDNITRFHPGLQDAALHLAEQLEGLLVAVDWSKYGFAAIRPELAHLPASGLELLFSLPLAAELSLAEWQQIGAQLPELDWQQYYHFARLSKEGLSGAVHTTGGSWQAVRQPSLDLGTGHVLWSADGRWAAKVTPDTVHILSVTKGEKLLSLHNNDFTWAPSGEGYVVLESRAVWFYLAPGIQGVKREFPEGMYPLVENRLVRWWNGQSIILTGEGFSYYLLDLLSGEILPIPWQRVHNESNSHVDLSVVKYPFQVSLEGDGQAFAHLNYPLWFQGTSSLWSPEGSKFILQWGNDPGGLGLPARYWLMGKEGAREIPLPPRTEVVGWLKEGELIALQHINGVYIPLIYDLETNQYGYIEGVQRFGSYVSPGPHGLVAIGPENHVYIYQVQKKDR